MLPLNRNILTTGVQRIETLLLEHTLQNDIYLWLVGHHWFTSVNWILWWWILHTHSDAHVFNDISIDNSNRNIIQLKYTWISCKMWHFIWFHFCVIEILKRHWWLWKWINMTDFTGRWNDNDFAVGAFLSHLRMNVVHDLLKQLLVVHVEIFSVFWVFIL